MTKITETAEKLLDSMSEPTAKPTKYIAGFRTKRGRELALERERNSIFVWTEHLDIPGSLFLRPVRHYPPNTTRNSNLNRKNSPRLIVGKAVDYWNLEFTEELKTLMEWYQKQ